MTDDDKDVEDVLAELEAEIEDGPSLNNSEDTQISEESQTLAENSVPTGSTRHAVFVKAVPYTILSSDADALQFTTEHDKAVVHFRHENFAKCAIMDDHLSRIANAHDVGEAGGDSLAFGVVDVEQTPFIVEKLGIRVLPCVMGFAKGVLKGKVLGFEGICWGANESSIEVTKALEATFFTWGLLNQKLLAEVYDSEEDDLEDSVLTSRRRGIKGTNKKIALDDDDDWD